MKKGIALVGILAMVGFAGADTMIEVTPGGLLARVYDASIGIEYQLVNVDNTTDYDLNGQADSVWEVRVTNLADGPDWTNAKFDSTVTPGAEFNCWDSGDLFGGSIKAYQMQDAFVGNAFVDPSGDTPLMLTPDQVWPSKDSLAPARGHMNVGFFHTSTNDVGLVAAVNGRFIIPDNEAGDLRILEVFGSSYLDATFAIDYNPATQRTFIVSDSFARGDLNCDGSLNVFDIDPFVLALTSPDQYVLAYPDCDRMLADINCDGGVNTFDIDPFVSCLTGGGCPPCP